MKFLDTDAQATSISGGGRLTVLNAVFNLETMMNGESLNARTAYFDESHTHYGARFPLVAGFVSQTDRWLLFDREWDSVLREFGVSGFHMREFAPSRGEFKSWKGDEDRRVAFMDSLLTLIEKHVEYACSVSVDEREFQKYRAYLARVCGPVPRIDQVPWSGPYEFAGYTACIMVNTWLQERWGSPPGFPIQIVFDHGNENGHYLAKGYSAVYKNDPAHGRWGMPPEIAFEKRQSAAPLQAADLLAWETGKFADDMRRGIVRSRKSFARLAKLPGRSWVVTGRELQHFERYYLEQSILNVKQRAA